MATGAQPIAQFSGLASGIDSASLIDAIIQARERQNDIRRTDIDHLNSENEALEELNTKFLALNDLIDKFRTSNGGGITKKTSSSDATVATASASSAANNTTTRVTVTSVAAAGTASYNDTYATTNTAFAPNASGTQTIGVDIGTGGNLVSINVDVDSTTTIQQYVDAFNADTDAVGRAVASIVNVGTSEVPSYKVVITALKTGTADGTIAFNVPGPAGFGGQTDLQNRTVQQATDAVFTISGISGNITRSTNNISDVISGVTFQISKVGTADIVVSDDGDSTADQIQEIIDAYNDVVTYIAENDIVTRAEENGEITNVHGSLAKTRIDNDFIAQFRSALSSATSTTGGAVGGFADLGLSTNRDGTISFDAEKFKSSVASDTTGAAQVLRSWADSSAGVSGFIYQFTTFDGFIDTAQESNNNQIQTLNDSIDQVERGSESLRKNLQRQFARLESITAQLQGQQAALTAALAGLPK